MKEATESLLRILAGMDEELPESISRESALRLVTPLVEELLATNLSKMTSVLYRIDVSEVDVKAVFRASSAAELAGRLASLLLDRQLRKPTPS
jgi:hypothetical protein